ncbi:MAG: thymidine phosphorylase family protein [Alphaproteobacteria bacterium]|nr:thymidine phosphorylase family protein [Alphaproteobacteria bacterium]MBT5389506.1 thymidine phosphorylase family protein [Alphaproteobacteria bacterium]MBT5654092.1 thymidine phosphorylase family protein [Alphaproteobacteria bacterium]
MQLKRLGIDTYKEAVIYLRTDCHMCRSEGFEVHARVRVTLGGKSILATLNTLEGDLLQQGEASLSNYAWELLGANDGDPVQLSHPNPLQSLSFVRSKIYGNSLKKDEIKSIIGDIALGRYSDIHIAAFLTACAGGRLNEQEVTSLTESMIEGGQKLTWSVDTVVDKHCVGGLPGNRTTPIIVPIVTAFGLTMPKTSSRAITSPAGTADTMETLAPVDLDLKAMKRVVEQEQGCIVWGGSVSLSPADDILIGVERAMDLDSEGQLVASMLSKKISVSSTHVLIDIPVGPTAKVRSFEMAHTLEHLFQVVAQKIGLNLSIILSDGSQPVGRGIGPALEAWDILAVLQNKSEAPQDLRERALILAGNILEFSPKVAVGEGRKIAEDILESGKAFEKFQKICEAQGGLREPPVAKYTHSILSPQRGCVANINNRQLARLAKLAGAPHDKAAGVELHVPLRTLVDKGEPLVTIHAESKGELSYALSLLDQIPEIIQVEAGE